MPSSRPVRPARKRPNQYHHGDLRRALLQEAVRVIQTRGVEGLTLRSVGEKLGVSRTALYRHFADKSALLGAVAAEGFRTLRLELRAAWGDGQGGFDAFGEMGAAYVRFATSHPSHYRVMFGSAVDDKARDVVLEDDATDAFGVLVEALVMQQQRGLARPDDPTMLARYIWAIVHGVAMLAICGQLPGPADVEALTRYAVHRIRADIEMPPAVAYS